MTILLIEQCVRPNFVWDKCPHNRWLTVPKVEGANSIGLIVFVGLTYMYGFKAKEVMDYIGITRDKYFEKLAKFREFARDEDNIRFRNKVGLCLNRLRLSCKSSYVKLDDLGY